MCKKALTSLVVIYVLLAAAASGQDLQQTQVARISTQEMEGRIKSVIEKVYPACVFLADYDTVRQGTAAAGMRFSGVVVSENGLIMTAAHASLTNKLYQVTFPDGRKCLARGLGRIARFDAALMKIEGDSIRPYAEMGWSSSMQLYETCVSIAYPGTFDGGKPVVRVGYLADTTGGFRPTLTTTCLMEPGDSGGPVFDILGRVVGICSGIDLSPDKNFEVPVDMFRKYWTSLLIAKDYKRAPEEEVVPTDPLIHERAVSSDFFSADNYPPKLIRPLSGTAVMLKSWVKDSVQLAMGTVMSAANVIKGIKEKSGFVVGKSSLIGNDPVLAGSGNKRLTVIARDTANDLVLLRPERPLRAGIDLAHSYVEAVDFGQLGTLLVSVFPEPEQNEQSIVASAELTLPRKASAGQLGIFIASKDSQLFVNRVMENSAASAAHLQEGDKIISVNEVSYNSPEALTRSIQQNDPGDIILLKGMRGDSVFNASIILKRRMTDDHVANMFTDGRSIRRDGFQTAFIHDGRIKPEKCGGPVFDSNGVFRGINIARASRTSSIIIPASAVWAFIKKQQRQSQDN